MVMRLRLVRIVSLRGGFMGAVGDLPPGKWTSELIGAWWPGPPTTFRHAAQSWGDQAQQQENYAGGLGTTGQQLSRNKGVTADDLVGQYHDGKNFHFDLAEKYLKKQAAANSAADAIDNLRSGLRSIADDYNQKISEVEKSLNSKSGLAAAMAVAKIVELIAEANASAAHKSAAAVASVMDAIQKVLTAEGQDISPQEFLKSHGLDSGPPHYSPPNEETVKNNLVGTGSGTQSLSASHGDQNLVGTGSGEPAGGNATPLVGPGAGGAPVSGGPIHNAGGGIHVPGGGGGGAHVPSGVPGVGGLSPAAAGNALSPASLGKSFESGLQAGQPAAAGAQSLANGTIHAAAAPPPPAAEPPQVAPHAIPTLAASGDGAFASNQHGASAATPTQTVSSPDHYAAPATTVVAAPMSAPGTPVGGAPASAGPLPAYGSDLRPMTAAPPVAPAVQAGPAAGAPIAASPASSPSAGGLVSPVERATPAAATGAQANASAAAGAGLVSATAGAVAGDAAKRVAAQRDLQVRVDAVARQEPALAWATGLLDDETTVLLATDLAGGWIPPHVKLPTGITLLAPAARRPDMSAVDLLGSVTVAAAYQPHGYIADTAPGDPTLTGERARHGQYVDEFGPTLVDAVTRRSGLPAVAQPAAKAAVRRTGVLEAEVDELRRALDSLRAVVISAYPNHKPDLVANWMLLSAIEALVNEHAELGHYHLAWYMASFATTAGRQW